MKDLTLEILSVIMIQLTSALCMIAVSVDRAVLIYMSRKVAEEIIFECLRIFLNRSHPSQTKKSFQHNLEKFMQSKNKTLK